MPKDACYHKVKARYKVFPSAYASGAIAKCRKVGAANYGTGGKKKKTKKKAEGGVIMLNNGGATMPKNNRKRDHTPRLPVAPNKTKRVGHPLVSVIPIPRAATPWTAVH